MRYIMQELSGVVVGCLVFVHVEEEEVLGVVVLVLEFDVLVQRALGAVRFIAFIDVAGVVARDLHGRPAHALPAVLVLGVGQLPCRAAVNSLILKSLDAQFPAQALDFPLERTHLSRKDATCPIFRSTSWCILAAYR